MKQFPAILSIPYKGHSIRTIQRTACKMRYTRDACFLMKRADLRGKLIIGEEWKYIRVMAITLLTIIFSGSAFARIGNSARSSDLESLRCYRWTNIQSTCPRCKPVNYNCKTPVSLCNTVARYRWYNRAPVPRSGIKTDKQVLSRKHVNRHYIWSPIVGKWTQDEKNCSHPIYFFKL